MDDSPHEDIENIARNQSSSMEGLIQAEAVQTAAADHESNVMATEPKLESESGSPAVVYLLQHGNSGDPEDWALIAGHIIKHHKEHLPETRYLIFQPASNATYNSGTHDGIEQCGERLFLETQTFFEEHGVVQGSSLVVACHSLGGLITRYALGVLEAKGLLEGITCLSYLSLCSPHLGIQAPLAKGLSSLNKRSWVNFAGTLSKGGMMLSEGQLVYDDYESDGGPLLRRMSIPGTPFMEALGRFKEKTCIGFTHFDVLVPCATSTLSLGSTVPIPGSDRAWRMGTGQDLLYPNQDGVEILTRSCQDMFMEKKRDREHGWLEESLA